jgi:hypothetical protein
MMMMMIMILTSVRPSIQTKRHGVTPVESSEPTYIATTVFASKQQFEEYNKKNGAPLGGAGLAKAPETVFYEGTLMLSAP